MCLWGAPAPVYKGARGEEAAGQGGRAKGGVLLPVGVGLILARPSSPAAPPPLLLYILGQGAPLGDTTIDPLDLLAVCGAPSTIIHLDNIVAVLRRSPTSVEHHHRHHAIMLTELYLKARLDRSSRDVIELNVCRTRRCRVFGT